MRRRTRIALVLGAFLLAFPIAEGAYRLTSRLRGKPYDAQLARTLVESIASSMNESLPRIGGPAQPATADASTLQPYIGVDQRSSMAATEDYARQFRGGALDDAFVVVVLGGSVAAMTATNTGATIVETLQRDPRLAGRRVVLIPQGRGSFKQPQQLTLLAYLLSIGWDPDAVINVDGFNESALAWDNLIHAVHPAYPAYSGWALLAASRADISAEIRAAGEIVLVARDAREFADRALAGPWLSSAITGDLCVRRLSHTRARWFELQGHFLELLRNEELSEKPESGVRNPAQGPLFLARGSKAARLLADCWFESSLSLNAVCAARGIAYLHVLQPTLHDEGSKPLTPEEVQHGGALESWIEAVHTCYPLLRERGRTLSERGVAFADLSGLFHDYADTVYFDLCHMRGAGAELFARRVAQELLARLPESIPQRRQHAPR